MLTRVALRSTAVLVATVVGVFWVAAGTSGCGRCSTKVEDPLLRDFQEIIDSKRLHGWSRAEVHAAFGEPIRTYGVWNEQYFLSPQASCIDSRWLSIRYDDTTGRVIDVGYTED